MHLHKALNALDMFAPRHSSVFSCTPKHQLEAVPSCRANFVPLCMHAQGLLMAECYPSLASGRFAVTFDAYDCTVSRHLHDPIMDETHLYTPFQQCCLCAVLFHIVCVCTDDTLSLLLMLLQFFEASAKPTSELSTPLCPLPYRQA